MTEKHIVIYHDDSDGLCSAAVVNHFLKQCYAEPKVEFLAYNYDKGFDPKFTDKETTLWIVDFSLPIELMWTLNNTCKKIFWFDHHQSAINKLVLPENLTNVKMVLDTKRAGCGITWDTLFPSQSRPLIIDLVEDRDLWKFKLPNTKAFGEAFYSEIESLNDPRWDIFFSPGWDNSNTRSKVYDDMISNGNALMKAKAKRVRDVIRKGYYGTIKGHKAYFVNSPVDISEIGEQIYLSHTEPIVAVIYQYINSEMIQFSLRSNQINVREIAELFKNGGGHSGAAGFNIMADKKRWNRVLKDNPER